MKKKITLLISVTAIIIASIALLPKCSVEDESFVNTQQVMERIDMKIVGAETEYFYLSSLQGNTAEDLVDYNFYGQESSKIDFKVNLEQGKTLVVKLFNHEVAQPWEYDGESYGSFAPQDLNSKYKYVTFELLSGKNGEVASYVSNIAENFPQGGFLDVFRIEEYNLSKMEMLCRVNNITLYQINNPDNTITIDGTFRGSLTFL